MLPALHTELPLFALSSYGLGQIVGYIFLAIIALALLGKIFGD